MYVRTDEEVAALCSLAAAEGILGIDLEFIPERTFYPQLALIQIAVGDRLVLVDPLAGLDLSPFEALIADGAVRKVLHAGGQDLWILTHRTGRMPVNVFDTQIAGAMAGLGHQVSYAEMAARLVSARVSKSESFTDWLRRPLTPAQEAYALEDVRHLLPCARILSRRLHDRGRLGWAQEEMERFGDPALYETDPMAAHEKVRRAGSLKGPSRAALIELAAWRELEARRADLPRRRFVPDEVLVEVARRMPRGADDLASVTGLGKRDRGRYGRAMLDAVRRGAARVARDGAGGPADPIGDRRELVDLFLAVGRASCESRELAWAAVASRADVEELVAWLGRRDAPDRPRLLTGWRAEAIGTLLVDFVDGKVSLSFDRPGGALRIS